MTVASGRIPIEGCATKNLSLRRLSHSLTPSEIPNSNSDQSRVCVSRGCFRLLPLDDLQKVLLYLVIN